MIRMVFFPLLAGVLSAMIGCEGMNVEPKMSYKEALDIYKTEVELLNELKSRRAGLQAELAKLDAGNLAIQAADLQQIGGALAGLAADSALESLAPGSAGTDETAEKAQDPSSALLGQIGDQLQQAQAQQAAAKEKLAAEVSALDQSISEQEQKVARALADKEEAESNR